jgi:hypothetical protein
MAVILVVAVAVQPMKVMLVSAAWAVADTELETLGVQLMAQLILAAEVAVAVSFQRPLVQQKMVVLAL